MATNLKHPETLFRNYMCRGCLYRERKRMRSGDRLYCGIPCTKDCVLEDWEMLKEDAIEYTKAVFAQGMEEL